MLYRSKQIGIIATVSSFTCTLLCPILSYVLGTWDIELFKELILIGTNGTAVIEGAFPGITLLNIEKIILYLVFPRLLMIGSCALLLFNNIKLGVNHVENQIQLFRIGNRDALTGLFNRNCYQELLENSKTEDPVGVIFFDVNGLKAANDSNGHEYGDLLLQRSAKSLLDVCDENSYGFRLGGDEFAIICFGANEETTCEKIVAWQASLTKINLENESKYDGLICSLAYGYACGPISQLEELTRLSDHRMYQRKLSMKTAR